ncbi:MAG: hypothetical protein U0165_15130 [Polyangiaceae bacterium]
MITILIGVLHTRWGQEQVRVTLEKRVTSRMNGSLSIGTLSFALFGDIRVGHVVLRDASNAEAIAIDSVWIKPSWRELIQGAPSFDLVEVSGVRAHIERREDGTSNLSTLFKAKPPTSPTSAPPAPSKPLSHARVGTLSVQGVSVDIARPDGLSVRVSDAALGAHIDAFPVSKSAVAALDDLHFDVAVSRPDGLSVKLDHFHTTGRADVKQGTGPFHIGRTTVHASLVLPGATEQRDTDVDLGELDVDVTPERAHAMWTTLSAAAVAIDSIESNVSFLAAEGVLPATQARGITLDATKLNQALGKEILAVPVTLQADVSGEAQALDVGATISSTGGNVSLASKSDVVSIRRSTEATLTISSLDTSRLLIPTAIKAPPITLAKAALKAKAAGATRADLVADFELDASGITVGGIPIDGVLATAHLEKGQLSITKLVVTALSQELAVAGQYELESKRVRLDLSTRGKTQDLLVGLRKRGLAIPPVASSLELGEGELVHVEGVVGGELGVDIPKVRLGVASGTAVIDAHLDLAPGDPEKTDKKIVVKSMRADARVSSIPIHQLASYAGKNLRGARAVASGEVHVTGTPENPSATFDLSVVGGPSEEDRDAARVRMTGLASRSELRSKVSIVRRDAKDPLVDADVLLPLFVGKNTRSLAADRPLVIDLHIPKVSVKELAALVPPELLEGKTLPDAMVGADVHLRGTAAQPVGTVDVNAEGALVSALSEKQTLSAHATLNPAAEGVRVEVATQLAAGADPQLVTARTVVELPSSPLVQRPTDLRWSLDAKMDPKKISSLPVAPESVSAIAGTVGLTVAASGTNRDVSARVVLDARDVAREKNPPIDARFVAELAPTQSEVSLEINAAKIPVAKLAGTVGVAGQGLVPAIREKKLDVPLLALTLSLVPHSLDELAPLRPAWKGTAAKLGGSVEIKGRATSPVLNADVALDDITTLDGGKARAALHVDGSLDEVKAVARLNRVGVEEGLTLTASTRPKQLLGKGGGLGDLDIQVALNASHLSLASVVPVTEKLTPSLNLEGELNTDLSGTVGLRITPLSRSIRRGGLRGSLALNNVALTLPKSTRRVKNVNLNVNATDDGVEITKLEAHESDVANSDRQIHATGKLGLNAFQPGDFELALRSKDWLVHGTPALGPTDAPRGELSADLSVSGDLSSSMKKIRVNVNALELSAPDRFLRSHAAEVVSTGDLLVVDDAHSVGQLVRSSTAATSESAKREPPSSEGTVAGAPTGLELDVTVPKPIHIKQFPMNVYLQGSVHLDAHDGQTVTSGKLSAVAGDFTLGGLKHELRRGEIRFESSGPPVLDLEFARAPTHAAQLDFALDTSSNAEVHARLNGAYGKQKIEVSGAADSIFDALFVSNTGRPRWMSSPTLPTSETAQLPQMAQVRQVAFVTVNLPHLLFLDRVRVYAAPSASLTSYGKLETLEGERYSADGSRRTRVASRPPTAGQSDAEVEYDVLLKNSNRVISGIGVVGGTRGGGGPSVFFEWSSRD